VTATCAADAVPLVEALGVDVVVDYTAPDARQQLALMRGYDVILDCSGVSSRQHLDLLKPWTYSKYVTLSSPLLRNADSSGLLAGGVRSAAQLVSDNLASHSQGSSYRWAFFMPNGCALAEVTRLVEAGRLRSVVQREVAFAELPAAYRQAVAGHSRGKTVVRVVAEDGDDSDAQRRSSEPA